jgi:hypothetical protein
MATMNTFNHFSEILEMRMIEKQNILFESGSLCACGERKYRPIVNGMARKEICPVCEGNAKVIDLI